MGQWWYHQVTSSKWQTSCSFSVAATLQMVLQVKGNLHGLKITFLQFQWSTSVVSVLFWIQTFLTLWLKTLKSKLHLFFFFGQKKQITLALSSVRQQSQHIVPKKIIYLLKFTASACSSTKEGGSCKLLFLSEFILKFQHEWLSCYLVKTFGDYLIR